MFSSRVPASRRQNRLARALAAARARGRTLLDLTVSNPTTVGFHYSPELLQPLASPAALTYTPQPFGLETARAAVAREYMRRGIEIASRCVVLTASTSEAYSLLFKLLCAPADDAVMVPIPSYPLFDHLTQLDGIGTLSYPLDYHTRWTLDLDALDRQWTRNVRAVLAVSPNNPTGSLLSRSERALIDARCAERDAALILDEVFADFIVSGAAAAGEPRPCALTFRLGGLSKSAGLPQVKLGWIGVDGPPALVDEALDRLELICDTYLSVSTPVQTAAPGLIASGVAIRGQILDRIRANYETLRAVGGEFPSIEVLPVEGGWSAVVRVPSTRSEEELVLELLERDDVLVHPGFFFDFPHEAFLVMSLLPEPSGFARGVRALMERVS